MSKRSKAENKLRLKFNKQARRYNLIEYPYGILSSCGHLEAKDPGELYNKFYECEEEYLPLSDEEQKNGIPQDITDSITRLLIGELRDWLRAESLPFNYNDKRENFFEYKEFQNRRLLLKNKGLKIDLPLPRAQKDIAPLIKIIDESEIKNIISIYPRLPQLPFYQFTLKDIISPEDLSKYSKKFQSLIHEGGKINVLISSR